MTLFFTIIIHKIFLRMFFFKTQATIPLLNTLQHTFNKEIKKKIKFTTFEI